MIGYITPFTDNISQNGFMTKTSRQDDPWWPMFVEWLGKSATRKASRRGLTGLRT